MRNASIISIVIVLTIAGCNMFEKHAPMSVILTADTQGQVEACRDCQGTKGLGGIARRATVVADLRQEDPNLLLVDAGNSFFGAENLDTRGKVIIAAYNAMDYNALNLSYRDFHFGKSATLELIRGAKFPVISANLLDEKTGEPLTKPYVVAQVGEEKIALIGVTQSPAGLNVLPHLKEQLAGIHIQPPNEALKKWLPKAKEESDRIILIYYGSVAGLQPVWGKFSKKFTAVLVGGSKPDYLPSNTVPPIVGTHPLDRQLAHLRFGPETGKGGEVTQVAIDSKITPMADIEILVEKVSQESYTQVVLEREEREQEETQPSETVIQEEGEQEELEPSQPVEITQPGEEIEEAGPARTILLAKGESLGISIQTSNEQIRITKVKHGSPGEAKGLRVGDIITHLDGKQVHNPMEVKTALKAVGSGRQGQIVLTLKSGRETFSLTIRGEGAATEEESHVVAEEESEEPDVTEDARIRHAQELLTRLGLDPGSIDGRRKDKTEGALRQFQKWYPVQKLKATGQLDDPTYQALQNAVAAGMQPEIGTGHRRTTTIPHSQKPPSPPKVDSIYRIMDDYDRAQMKSAFETRTPEHTTRWTNPNNNKQYTMTLGPTHRSCQYAAIQVTSNGERKSLEVRGCKRGAKWTYNLE